MDIMTNSVFNSYTLAEVIPPIFKSSRLLEGGLHG